MDVGGERPRGSSPRHRHAVLALALALVLWRLADVPSLAVLAPAYLGAALVLGALSPRRLGGPLAAALCLGLVGLGLWADGGWRARVREADLLDAIVPVQAARRAARRRPAIAPRVLTSDRPQTLWIEAEGTEHLRLSAGGSWVEAEPLATPGRFRLRFDPRRHGVVDPERPVQLELDGRIVDTELLRVGPRPRPERALGDPDAGLAVALDPGLDLAWIVDRDGRRRDLAVADGPVAAAALGEGRFAIAHRHAAELWCVDARTATVAARWPVPGLATAVAVSPDARRLALALARPRPRVVELSLADGRVDAAFELDAEAQGLAYGTDADVLIVAQAAGGRLAQRVRTASGWRERRAPLIVGRPPRALTRAPDGRSVVFAISDLRPDGGPGPNHRVAPHVVRVDTASLRRLSAQAVLQAPSEAGPGQGGDPTAIVLAGSAPLLVSSGTGELARLGTEGRLDVVVTAETLRTHGLQVPSGLAALGDARWLVTSAVDARLAVVDADGRVIRLHALTPGRPDAWTRGGRSFFASTRAGPSCASCHPDHGSDHALHDIGHEVSRPTLDARGVAGTAPFLRGASYPSLASLEAFGREVLGGWLDPEPDRAALLAAYVAALPPPDPPPPLPLAAVDAGLAAFERAGCAGCHAFPAFTDLAQHPAAALFGPERGEAWLDTPSLLGVAERSLWLHDGRARALEDVLLRFNPRRSHGDAERLDPSERRALLRLLEAL